MSRGLLYTDAPEITGLANLPLGLALGPVYQLIDVPLLGSIVCLIISVWSYWTLLASKLSNISAWAHKESKEQRPSSFDELTVWAWAMIFSLEVRWLRKWGADHAQTWLGILDSHSAVIHVQWQSLHHIWLEKPMAANVLFLPDSRTMSHCLFLPLTAAECHCPSSPLR